MSLNDLEDWDGELEMCVYTPTQSEVCNKAFMDGLWELFTHTYASLLTREISTECIASILNGIGEFIMNNKHFFLDVECFEREAENNAIRKYEMYIEGKCSLEALQDRCSFLVLARCGVALSNQHNLQGELVRQTVNRIRECQFENLKTNDEFVAWLKDGLGSVFTR